MQIALLGPVEVRAEDGAVVEVPGARLRALLVALALDPGRNVSRTRLIDWIWGDSPPAEATNALQRLASRLRKILPHGVIEAQAGGYRLVVDPDVVDAVRFERLVGQARHEGGGRQVELLREALALWRGAALQDVGLDGTEAAAAAASRLEGLRLLAQEDRYEVEISLGHGAELVAELTDVLSYHPLRERLAGALMRALAAGGRDSEALIVYERTREALAEALGADPSAELSALHVSLLKGEVAPGEPTSKTNLRAALTSFVGRDDDLAGVTKLLTEHRLITLIGPGGAGKTRLATETGRTLTGDLADGVWLVELAASGADSDVTQAAVAGVGLRDALLGAAPSADPIDGLIAAIRDHQALLILDNCEHVIDAAAAFADRMLGACPRLRIMATSREPLGITGEALWQVEPLAIPADATLSDIAATPAIRLLRDRAQAVRPDLGRDEFTLTMMTRICRALDGMPLAIELAAARLRTMSVAQLADRLDDRFRLLTNGSRTALPRHKTLRAVVDWSWELLTADERIVLHRLAIFAGSASVEAAEHVCARVAHGPAVDRNLVLELLSSLVDKSLVVRVGEGVPRYRMLTTIREYAAGCLEESGESDAAREAHLAYFTELVETAEPHLRRAEQLEWLAILDADHDNINAAVRGAVGADDAQAAMRLVAAAGWYWWLGGRRAEGFELIIAATRVPGEVADHVRAMTYGMVVLYVTSGRGDEKLGADWIHRAYQLFQRSRHPHALLRLVVPLERMLHEQTDAVSAFESLLDSEDPWVRALARLQAGKMRIVFGQGGPEAEALLEMALEEFRTLGERFGISMALSELAGHLAMRGEFATALERYEEGIAVVAEVGAVEDVIRLRTQQALLHWLQGDRDGSARGIDEAERSADGVTWPHALVEVALAKATLARWSGETQQARDQVGVATALLGRDAEQAAIRVAIHDLLGYLAGDVDSARAHRVAAFEAAAEAGHALVIAQMLVGTADLALRLDDHEQAARLLAASFDVRGMPDHSQPDAARIEQDVRHHLGAARFAELTYEGTQKNWPDLAAVTLHARHAP